MIKNGLADADWVNFHNKKKIKNFHEQVLSLEFTVQSCGIFYYTKTGRLQT